MDDLTFERSVLSRIAAETAYPAMPALRAGVLASIGDIEAVRHAGPVGRPFALAAVAALLIAALVTFAVPGSRHAVADFFGVRGSKVEILPTPPAGMTPTPLPTPVGIRWIATPTSLQGAQDATGFEAALAPGEGQPLGVYLVDYVEAPVVVLEYARFDLWESRGAGFFVKGVAPGTTVRDLTVKGQPATWIGEGEHIVAFEDANGQRVTASVRTVERGTLIWNSGSTFYRLETDLGEDDAVHVAESLP